jgi:hypothetical protein
MIGLPVVGVTVQETAAPDGYHCAVGTLSRPQAGRSLHSVRRHRQGVADQAGRGRPIYGCHHFTQWQQAHFAAQRRRKVSTHILTWGYTQMAAVPRRCVRRANPWRAYHRNQFLVSVPGWAGHLPQPATVVNSTDVLIPRRPDDGARIEPNHQSTGPTYPFGWPILSYEFSTNCLLENFSNLHAITEHTPRPCAAGGRVKSPIKCDESHNITLEREAKQL